MQVIAFACQKGAAGKTTLAGHLAVQAGLSGDGPVVLLDTDQQGALAEWWNLRKDDKPAFAHTFIENIERDIAALDDLGFGVGMIDTPSAISPAVESIVRCADLVVIPCRPSPHDLRAVAATVDLVQALGKPFVFVINGAEPGEQLNEDAAAALSGHGPVAPIRIHNNTDCAESMFDGRTAMEFNPGGDSAGEMAALWAYLQEQLTATAGGAKKAGGEAGARRSA
jgi:chromosome partitioning protein